MTGITLAHPLAFKNTEHAGRFPAAIFLPLRIPILSDACNRHPCQCTYNIVHVRIDDKPR